MSLLIDYSCFEIDVEVSSINSFFYKEIKIEELICFRNNVSIIKRLPAFLKVLDCGCNYITKIPMLPISLSSLTLEVNSIQKIENLPLNLISFNCQINDIKIIENLPLSLSKFNCSENNIKVIENLPIGLTYFKCSRNPIEFVDAVSIDSINFTLKGYQAIRRIQLRMKRRYRNKVNAVNVIYQGMERWLFAGICKDKSISIDLKLGLLRLKEDGIELS